MIQKEKLFLVASNVDDSIKSVTPIYDITIFPDFLKFEEYINETPIKLGTIIISARELPFTSANMARLLELLAAPFLKLTGNCIYLYDTSVPKQMVEDFIEDNEVSNILTYQGDLSSRFITDIVSGAARLADETATEIVTYRMRASDYITSQNIKKYESDDEEYVTDEESLSNIPSIEEPMVQVPSIDILSNTYYVVGKRSLERTLFAFLEAQYLSLTGKTIIVESDVQFHRLSDIVLRSTASYDFIDIEDFLVNPTQVINYIRSNTSRLIVIGAKNRIVYDYDFVFDILSSNLLGWVDYMVKECEFSQTPYGQRYNIVCADTIPDILECCSSLAYDVDEKNVIMIGLRTSDKSSINVTSLEMTDIVRTVLEKNNLVAQVLSATDINLRGEGIVYDLFSIIGRGNERQG